MLDLAASVLNLYYNLAAANDELKARQRALEIAQKFHDDTKRRSPPKPSRLSSCLAPRRKFRSRRQELQIAQSNVRQQEVQMKEAISHSEDPALEAAGIVLVDRIQIPDTDDLPPLRELVATAMAKRPDVAVSKYRDQTDEINLAGTTNPLLPALNLTLQTYDRGVNGVGHVVDGVPPNSNFVGGYGHSFQQVLQHDFPNYLAPARFFDTVRQPLRPGRLRHRPASAPPIAGLQPKRHQHHRGGHRGARDGSSPGARPLQYRPRDARCCRSSCSTADRQHFTSGGKNTTFEALMADQRALVNAQISEVNALAAYAQARTSLDQVLGETLEKNNISLDEGLNGRVERQSQLPDVLDSAEEVIAPCGASAFPRGDPGLQPAFPGTCETPRQAD